MKKNILSYLLYLSVIALICIFKSEIWSFIKSIFKTLFLALAIVADYIGKDNVGFVVSFTVLLHLFILLCFFYGFINVLYISLFLFPIFIAIPYIFNIELSLNSFNVMSLIFFILVNGLLWFASAL